MRAHSHPCPFQHVVGHSQAPRVSLDTPVTVQACFSAGMLRQAGAGSSVPSAAVLGPRSCNARGHYTPLSDLLPFRFQPALQCRSGNLWGRRFRQEWRSSGGPRSEAFPDTDGRLCSDARLRKPHYAQNGTASGLGPRLCMCGSLIHASTRSPTRSLDESAFRLAGRCACPHAGHAHHSAG